MTDSTQPAGSPSDTKENDVKRQHRDKGGVTLPDTSKDIRK